MNPVIIRLRRPIVCATGHRAKNNGPDTMVRPAAFHKFLRSLPYLPFSSAMLILLILFGDRAQAGSGCYGFRVKIAISGSPIPSFCYENTALPDELQCKSEKGGLLAGNPPFYFTAPSCSGMGRCLWKLRFIARTSLPTQKLPALAPSERSSIRWRGPWLPC